MFKRFASAVLTDVITASKDQLVLVAGENGAPAFDYDPENFVYFRCRAISADAANGNGDYFPADELVKAYKTFIGVGLYKDHDSDSIDKAIGKVLWADWIKSGNYIECICAVDKVLAPDLARRVESGIATSVSMGCSVKTAECGVDGCHNLARNAQELCEHMQPGFGVKGHMGPDGKIIYEINRGLQFTELSLVTVPADPTARIFEIYAKLKSRGEKDESLFRAASGEPITDMTNAELFAELRTLVHSLRAPVAQKTPSSPSKEEVAAVTSLISKINAAPVVKNQTFTEKKMGLTIEYQKGSNLSTSFFAAKDGTSSYRVAASEVLPLIVQSAIERDEPGIATPNQLISDLSSKMSSLRDFKTWAKRRRAKNRKAAAKSNTENSVEITAMKDSKPAEKCAPGEKPNPFKKDEKPGDKAAAPAPAAKPKPAMGGDKMKAEKANAAEGLEKVAEAAVEPIAPAAEAAPVEAAAEAPVEAAAEEPTLEAAPEMDAAKVLAAFDALRKFVESKFAAGLDKSATQVIPSAGHKDEEGKDKAAPAPKAGQEVTKTENPKGGMDKGAGKAAGIKVEAMDKDWSIDPKELEKTPKSAKPKNNLPQVISVEEKEVGSESLDPQTSGNAGAQVKKFYGRLPAKGAGEPEKAMDLKSSQDPEKEMLRKALSEERAKLARMAEKEKLQAVADKIYEIVSELQSRNIVAAGKEEAVIDTLTKKFTNLETLESLKALVGHFSKRSASEAEAVINDSNEKTEVETGGVVPQVFESVEGSEDVIAKLSSIWNL